MQSHMQEDAFSLRVRNERTSRGGDVNALTLI
jgi:hypothetical protein